jgi:hypothetical protein
VEWYQQRKTPDSSTRALWKFYHSHLAAKQEELVKEMINVALHGITVYALKSSLICHHILQHGTEGFISPPKEGMLWIFIALGRVWTSEPWIQWQAH